MRWRDPSEYALKVYLCLCLSGKDSQDGYIEWSGTYEDINSATGVSKENMWKYVRELRQGGLVEGHKWHESKHSIVLKGEL
jgi:hypothetical protein